MPKQLEKTLKLLISIPSNFNIYISIDFNYKLHNDWKKLVLKYNLPPIKWIIHDRKLGLEKHIITACDLLSKKGDFLVLEEDIEISRIFLQYIKSINLNLPFDTLIRQVSLSSIEWNELNHEPFYPTSNGYPLFLTKLTSSWGVFYRKEWWIEFSEYYKLSNKKNLFPHKSIYKWKNSWKKFHLSFLNDNNYFVIYPIDHLAIHKGINGTHFKNFVHNFSKGLCESFNFQSVSHYLECLDYENYYDINLRHSKSKKNIDIKDYFLRSFPLKVIIKHLIKRFLKLVKKPDSVNF